MRKIMSSTITSTCSTICFAGASLSCILGNAGIGALTMAGAIVLMGIALFQDDRADYLCEQ